MFSKLLTFFSDCCFQGIVRHQYVVEASRTDGTKLFLGKNFKIFSLNCETQFFTVYLPRMESLGKKQNTVLKKWKTNTWQMIIAGTCTYSWVCHPVCFSLRILKRCFELLQHLFLAARWLKLWFIIYRKDLKNPPVSSSALPGF